MDPKNVLRSYEIKNLTEGNLKRSIGGAIARAKDGEAYVMIDTKPDTKVPKKIEVLGEWDAQKLIEITTCGDIMNGCLTGTAYSPKIRKYLCVFVPIRAIDKCWVTYEELTK